MGEFLSSIISGMKSMVHDIAGILICFLRNRYRQFSPLLDYGSALVGLLIASPVLIVTGIVIKITSAGPVFYTQVRVGRYGRLFNIIKFRTMHSGAESQTGPVWTKRNDSRVTAMGRFLRNTHIDELPQLINILKGDMAIIGPRPERPHFVDMLNEEIHGYSRRLSVKPGITGLAQCYREPDEAIRDVKRKLRYDVLYIEKRCWVLDLEILWRTLCIGLLGGKPKPRNSGKLFRQEKAQLIEEAMEGSMGLHQI
jgi:lipopolysaccharide/colanic/teichoic acid biosynthesis glycosyltransferase